MKASKPNREEVEQVPKSNLRILRAKARAYFEAFEWAYIDSEIELQNLLIEAIFQLIPFETQEDKEVWLEYSATFMDLELFKEKTLAYFKR